MPQNESARSADWSDMFEAFDLMDKIRNDGFVDIEASQFHALHLQPRLMTKMDHQHQVPEVFARNGLNLLTRGFSTWRIGSFEIFHRLPEWTLPTRKIENLTLPSFVKTIDIERITGEPGVINAAHASGLLSAFTGEEQLLTVSGRMRTGEFSFQVADRISGASQINVSKAQIEIDAGMEGEDSFWIYEVKNHMSRDFCVRQLYYPYRTWLNRLSAKPVRTVFLTLANDVFDLHEFEFVEPHNYSSIQLVKHKRFTIGAAFPTEAEIFDQSQRALASPNFKAPEGVPFPQADDFSRVIDVLAFIAEEPRSKEDLAEYFGFDTRQSDYYGNAARYLGLAEKLDGTNGGKYLKATRFCSELLSLPYKEKNLKLAETLLEITPLAQTYFQWTKDQRRPEIEEVIRLLESSPEGAQLAESTVRRRAQTIRSWASWLRDIAPS